MVSKPGIAFAALSIGLLSSAQSFAQDETEVRLLMNWFPQANQGGYWQAQLDDKDGDGIKITTLAGGPRIQTIPQVVSGEAEFGIGYADDIMRARQMGAPVKAVYVALDHAPYDLVYHPDQGIEKVEDISGRTVAVSLGAAYWDWIKLTYNLETQDIPVSGDMSLFANDPAMVQQGLYLFLPFRMTEAGIPHEQFRVADLGYRPYEVLFTTDAMIADHPEMVQAAIAAVKKGWQDFMADPEPVSTQNLAVNKQISAAANANAIGLMKSSGLLPDDPKLYGCMDAGRWDELAKQLIAINAIPEDFDVGASYDASFVSDCE